MIAVVAGAQFALAVLGAPRHGVVSKLWHNAALSIRVLSEDVLALLYRAEEAYNGPRPFPGLSRQTCLASVGRGPLALAALVRIRRKGDAAPSSDGNWQLTAAGRERARSLVRAHRLWERYLGEHFALPLDHLHEPASRIEHYIGPGLQQQIAASLEQTDLDPHGRPIPSDPSTNQP
jgi:manganese/zinc/iron transport system permease protein